MKDKGRFSYLRLSRGKEVAEATTDGLIIPTLQPFRLDSPARQSLKTTRPTDVFGYRFAENMGSNISSSERRAGPTLDLHVRSQMIESAACQARHH